MLLLLLTLASAMPSLLAQTTVTLTGIIKKSQQSDIFIATIPNLLSPEERRFPAEVQNGQFRLDIPVTEPLLAELVHGQESVPLYLEPGYTLSLSFVAGSMLKSIKYTGTGANENSYLALHTSRFDEEEDYQTLPDNVKLPEKEFLEFLEHRREDQLAFFGKATKAKPLSAHFRSLLIAEIDLSYANDRLTFFDLRERMRLPIRLTPSAHYFSFLEQLDLEQQSALAYMSFPTFMRNYISFLTRQAKLDNSDIHFYKEAYGLMGQKLQGQARVMAQAHLIRQSLRQGNVLHVPAMLQHFGANAQLATVHAALQRQYESHTGLGIGSPAPEFALRSINGDTVSLSDFRGKAVYLSFWRTDCGPCLVEQPHAQELALKLQHHDVVMVSINVDENEQTWRSVVQAKGLEGVQLYLRGQTHELARQYGLKDLPAYFLIDENGTVLSTKPRRPIDREAEREILQYVMRNRASPK